ncbi:gamma-glutamyltransferase [Rhodopirellula sp. MGV]|uniref:gamma-glutamyltransferase n=1 Tax=Rhodopirellula sp. MGV TaxID=2023130 RepID=UPI000B96EAC8|nr:gamma-glutamyltransferase [Rhodopirellula sp. MGV]OYP34400.1 gamma-glutamyltransferase [Rhodopirellula sp. MGV]PNY37425.1 gamma-glutamyltransferase [Rhodopirellula baltica]
MPLRISLCVVFAISWLVDVRANPQVAIPKQTPSDVGAGNHGVVATTSPLASIIGRECLEAGGNAVDSAVATGFALAVTWPEAGNIGGGGFMLISPPNIASPSDVVCIDFRETAPQAATERSFVNWSQSRHAKMAGTPGSVAGMALAHQKYGSLAWKELVAPAIKLAKEGFVVDDYLAYSLNSALTDPAIKDARYDEFRRVLGHPDQRLWKPGDRLVQPDLAATLQRIADQGADGFYQGQTADKIVAEMKRGDGLISRDDLAGYNAVARTATQSAYQGHDVYGAPPPSSGGLTVGLQLRMLERLNLTPSSDAVWTTPQMHLMIEVMRRSFRLRAALLGDPATTEVGDAYDDAHVEAMARTISPRQATSSADIAGHIPLTAGPYESEQTTHYSVVDGNGWAVSTTTTLERSFGSWIMVKDAGVLLNNEMGDFNWVPGMTTKTGQIGTKANLVGPGKRMLSSMSPTIIAKNGQPVLVVGSPGGRTIINTVAEVIVQSIGFDRPLLEAVEAPRFHHQWFPDQVSLEDDEHFDAITPALQAMGHQCSRPSGRRQGSVHAIAIDPETGTATGVSDWRRGGSVEAAR